MDGQSWLNTTGHRLILEPELWINHWVPDRKNEHERSFLELRSPNLSLKKAIENLLIQSPKKKKF
jgi:hypothetical protein